MERNRCPGCGMPYNGKKCRNCLFQAVKTDLTSVSTEKKQTQASSGAPAGRRKQRSVFRSLLGFLVILALIVLLLPSLRNWGMELEETEHSSSAVQTQSD